VSRRTDLLLAASAAVTLALAAAPVMAQDSSSSQREAEDYCMSQGGVVVERKATLNADGDESTWVRLGESLNTCMFTSGDGDSQTQITVDLHTLYSEEPTLAGLAYLSAVPSSNSGAAGSNPASSYCPDDVGGTSAFGTAGTGGWVIEDPGMDIQYLVMDLCVFADRSAIDDFGLFYASAGEVRGIDLSTVMRYQPGDDMPQIFATGDTDAEAATDG
jgi:hypothetical protein